MVNCNPSFTGVYSKFRNQWYDFSKSGGEDTTAEKVKKDYVSSKANQALIIDSNNALYRCFELADGIHDFPVVLTGEHAKEYKASKNHNNEVKELFNKWYQGFYTFFDISTKKTDNVDFLDK